MSVVAERLVSERLVAERLVAERPGISKSVNENTFGYFYFGEKCHYRHVAEVFNRENCYVLNVKNETLKLENI